MLPDAVRQYLDDHRQEHVESLRELLRIPSIANVRGEPDACLRAAEWLRQRLEGLGLAAEILPTDGRPCVFAHAEAASRAPTLLIYGHYDVQPPEPLELWQTPPFEPVVRDGAIYARGANDDKGQLFTHLCAVEAWQRAGGGLPVHLKVLVEGEEEIGSPNIESFFTEHAERLAADAAVISDSEFFAEGLPSITYALRGVAYAEITVTGPRADVHSGLHGGALANPINALAGLVAALHDAAGRVTIPGFYDDVLPVSDAERRAWAGLPFDEAACAASLGVGELGGGERHRTALERRWARPTLDCNGIVGGYTGEGCKTIIPSRASAKLSMRLVPNQDPEKVTAALREFTAENAPPGVVVETEILAKARPVLLATDSPAMRAARAALKEAFGAEAAMIRCGASVPVTEQIQRLLGLDAVLMGFGLPDDNLHSPNERFRLAQLYQGAVASAAFLGNLGRSAP